MSLKTIRMIGVLSVALLGVCLASQTASAQQQGWPYTGGNPGWEGSYESDVGPSFVPTVPEIAVAPQVSTLIQLEVPVAAKVFFDGRPTTQTGNVRTFIAPPLATGGRFHYTVHVEWMDGGHRVERNQTINFNAGVPVNLDLMPHQNVDAPH
jgi:uncharacterized protein (TIGR03000 family)